jgi:hypothetical protein
MLLLHNGLLKDLLNALGAFNLLIAPMPDALSKTEAALARPAASIMGNITYLFCLCICDSADLIYSSCKKAATHRLVKMTFY